MAKKDKEEVDLGKILGMPIEEEALEGLEPGLPEPDVVIAIGEEGDGEDNSLEDEDPDLEAAVAEITFRVSEEVYDGDEEKATALVDNIRDLINILIPS